MDKYGAEIHYRQLQSIDYFFSVNFFRGFSFLYPRTSWGRRVDHPRANALATSRLRPVSSAISFAAVVSDAYPTQRSSSSLVILGSKSAIVLPLHREPLRLARSWLAGIGRSSRLLCPQLLDRCMSHYFSVQSCVLDLQTASEFRG